ncbi:unnamed protein product [Tetraodon nigroviridis]|uniref:(spotted green pufferfish) hypothetical protein n=1 Tax=Tetraodon nigroviridis TaxID=99883 RepID=Q4SJV5_TETNG|nr:unnamed protein product [Tetraodon nigroviridis]
MMEMQAKIEEERKALEAKLDMEEEEKNKAKAELEKRENDLLKAQFRRAKHVWPFEVDLSSVYLAYTEESMRQSLMKQERPRTSKSSKSGRPKTGRR